MGRGGKRLGSGAKSRWKCRPTSRITVPSIFATHLLQIAEILDDGDSLASVYEVLDSIKQTVLSSRSFSLEQTASMLTEDMVRELSIDGFYYITHCNNLASILEKGIFSHNETRKNKINPMTIYNSDVMEKRKKKKLPDDHFLWDYANLYFQPRNAMLYYLVSNINIDDLVILFISKNILAAPRLNKFISDGNAASDDSVFYTIDEARDNSIFEKIRNQIDKDWWSKNDGSKREMMAELLIYRKVPPKYISNIYIPSNSAKQKVEQLIFSCGEEKDSKKINLIVQPDKFFQPEKISRHKNISIIKGDLFFSRMQTLTVSVNCVGVMGSGLASTAKQRFPDVYVKYQNLCKSKQLDYGNPIVYKRESSVYSELSEELLPMVESKVALKTWFLLFPTKRHWKNNSDIRGIEKGLIWLLENYKHEGIESLAIPALGCGKGGLEWQEVAPLMCKYLVRMDIQVAIYAPAERTIPLEQVSSDFLFSLIDF